MGAPTRACAPRGAGLHLICGWRRVGALPAGGASAAGGAFQGRGELRAQPTTHARVVTVRKGLFGPCRTTGRWGLSAQFPAPLGCALCGRGTP
jgi:hypothetical protein